ncbi:MAG TPA: DUF4394 domain-containing protein, partial [Isosphaeraceae bacterium]
MRRNTVLLAGLSALLLGFTPAAHAEQIFGLVGGSTIVTFDSAAPGTILATRSITNLNAGELIQAIDLRPQDGLLYGYSTQNRIVNFTLGANAAANPVFAPTVGTNNTTATTPLST